MLANLEISTGARSAGRGRQDGGVWRGRFGQAVQVSAPRLPTWVPTSVHGARVEPHGRDRLTEFEAALLDGGAQVGGERAGSRIDAHLRPTTATFYVEAVPADLVAHFRMRPHDDGVVEFRRRFWQSPGPGTPLVPSPLVYADLVSSGDSRQREHAERIRGVDDRLVEIDRSSGRSRRAGSR